MAGVAHHGGEAAGDHVCIAQIRLGEHDDDGAVFLRCAKIALPHQAADDPRAVELGAGMRGIEGKTRDRQSAPARLGLVQGGCEIAIEGGTRQKSGTGVDQAVGVNRAQRSAQMLLEGVLTDQRQGGRRHMRGVAGVDFQVGELVSGTDCRCHNNRQVAEPGVLGQHRQEGVGHARRKPLSEHDAVYIAGVEVLCRRLDAECADDARALTERDGQRRIGAAAPDQQHRRIPRGIDIRYRHTPRGVEPAQHRRVQGAHAQ